MMMMIIIALEDTGNCKWDFLLVVFLLCVYTCSCECLATTLRSDPSINGCITVLGNDLRLMDVDFGGLLWSTRLDGDDGCASNI